MRYLVYVSSASPLFTRAELLHLLETSRRNNVRDGITGMLLYKDGNFMQAIEGEAHAVETLHAKIHRDPRHRGLTTLLKGPLSTRAFPGWSMAFRDLHSPELVALTGFNEFLNTPLTNEEFAADPTRAQRLLLSFKRSM